jgi:ParB family chromosome partitioning protein
MVKRIINENSLSERHARSLLRLPDEQLQIRALKSICDKGMSVQETEEMVRDLMVQYVRPDPNRVFGRSEIAESRKKHGKVKFIIKDIRVFVNTIREAVNMMKEAGIHARAAQFDREEYIEFVIRIPKKENGIAMKKEL